MKRSRAICSMLRFFSPPKVADGSGFLSDDGSRSGLVVMGSTPGRVRKTSGRPGYGCVTYGNVSMAAPRLGTRARDGGAERDTYPGCRRTARSASLQNPPDVLKHCKEPHL
ncbi:hypothetical protein GCM10022284_35870 [Streptomyces hundungensis]